MQISCKYYICVRAAAAVRRTGRQTLCPYARYAASVEVFLSISNSPENRSRSVHRPQYDAIERIHYSYALNILCYSAVGRKENGSKGAIQSGVADVVRVGGVGFGQIVRCCGA